MNVWVCRTGSHGEYEAVFLEQKKLCLTREGFNYDIKKAGEERIKQTIRELKPNAALQTISNTWSQIDIFANRMRIGDYIIIPKKSSSLISVARIIGEYQYSEKSVFPMTHSRKIEIIKTDIDSEPFPQSLKYSIGAFRSIFALHDHHKLAKALLKEGVRIREI